MDVIRAAISRACLQGGCPDLAAEIAVEETKIGLIISRPHRRLNDREAFAMCSAWYQGYKAAGRPVCTESSPEDCVGCTRGCVQNYDSERVVLRMLPALKAPWPGF